MHLISNSLAVAIISASVVVGTEPNKRQISECSSAAAKAVPAINAIPTADKTLREFIAGQTQFAAITVPCTVPRVTGSMADDFTSWVEEVYSWQSKYMGEITSFWAACTDVRQAENYVTEIPLDFSMFCSQVTWLGPTGTVARETETQNSENAAPRETGLRIAAAAMAAMAIAGVY